MFAYTALFLIFASFVSSQNVSIAIVRLQGTILNPGLDGVVAFYPEVNGNVTMVVNITGITSNTGATHGLHIHQFGDLTQSNGNSVASHLNILNQNHGCPENGGSRHIGDTGNWEVSAEGTIVGNKTLDLISLVGTNSIIGYGFVLHNQTDDCAVTTSSGTRLGFGVIGVANPTGFGTQNVAFPPPTQSGANSSAPTQAVCVLRSATPQYAGESGVTGTIWFSQVEGGIAVSANISGLVGTYPRGIHIHQWGDIRLDNGMSAGPHYTGAYYNATQPHNIPGSGFDHHVGDLGNIFNFDQGVAQYYNVLDAFGLFGDMNSIIGRAVIVHNLTDNCAGTNGNSGARIAQCVIGSANPAVAGAYAPLTNVPSAQNTSYCLDNPVPTTTTTTTGSAGSTSTTTGTGSAATGASTTTSSAALLFASFVLSVAMLLA